MKPNQPTELNKIREEILNIIGCDNEVNLQHTMEAQRPCSFCRKRADMLLKFFQQGKEEGRKEIAEAIKQYYKDEEISDYDSGWDEAITYLNIKISKNSFKK